MLLANAVLLAIIWGSTFVLQSPLHRSLASGVAAGSVERLVSTNWIRTASWSVRSVLLLLVLLPMTEPPPPAPAPPEATQRSGSFWGRTSRSTLPRNRSTSCRSEPGFGATLTPEFAEMMERLEREKVVLEY